MGGYSSSQREQTVNLLPSGFVGANPSLPTSLNLVPSFRESSNDMNEDIEECIRAIRTRIQYGHNKQQIAEGLGKFFPQDILFLCYHAATILEKAANEKK